MGLRSLLESARAAPWRFGFIPLLRRLAAGQAAAEPRIGHARRPRQEAFRLGQAADLAFAPREIAEVVLATTAMEKVAETAIGTAIGTADKKADGNAIRPATGCVTEAVTGTAPPLAGNRPDLPLVRLLGLGLLGPNGPLPLHYTEWVHDRSHNHRDGTLANFLDIFHHRYLTLFYRAWAQGQAAAGLDRPDDETFTAYVARLTGHDPLEIRDSVLPAHARLSASAHLVQGSRYPDGLAQTLSHYFAAPVKVEEFILHWIGIDVSERTRLGHGHPSSILAEGAVAGEALPDRQSKFRLVLGPLDIGRYLRFTPNGPDLPQLVAWVRAFVGFEFAWDLELRVHADSAPSARLEEGPRLGWSTWLGDAAWGAARHGGPLGAHAVGLVFEPEACACGHLNLSAAMPNSP